MVEVEVAGVVVMVAGQEAARVREQGLRQSRTTTETGLVGSRGARPKATSKIDLLLMTGAAAAAGRMIETGREVTVGGALPVGMTMIVAIHQTGLPATRVGALGQGQDLEAQISAGPRAGTLIGGGGSGPEAQTGGARAPK